VAACDAPDQARIALDERVPSTLIARAGRANEVGDIDVDNDLPPRVGNSADQLLRTIVRLR
jgi:hypothetical protein